MEILERFLVDEMPALPPKIEKRNRSEMQLTRLNTIMGRFPQYLSKLPPIADERGDTNRAEEIAERDQIEYEIAQILADMGMDFDFKLLEHSNRP